MPMDQNIRRLGNQPHEECTVIKRRIRQALSCQRCRKQRTKCSRSRPACEQCTLANVKCEYLEAPGDLESTALRDRFAALEDQIHALMGEFDIIEQLVYDTKVPGICSDALSSWHVVSRKGKGLSIETQMHHVEDIYAAVIQFALDNSCGPVKSPTISYRTSSAPTSLTRNNTIFPNVKLSHFNSLLNWVTPTAEYEVEERSMVLPTQALPRDVLRRILKLYNTCLLHGSIQSFDDLFHDLLMDHTAVSDTPALQLLLTSSVAYMLLHAHPWHPNVFEPTISNMTREQCTRLAYHYYLFAKELLSTLYFEEPTVITCHAICNLALFHMESGNTSAVYMYSGMAVRMGASMRLYCDDELENNAQDQLRMVPALVSIDLVRQYTHAVRHLLFFLDTNASHFHNKEYELEVDAGLSYDPQQGLFQWLEFQICQITRDIRNTCYDKDRHTIPYKEVLRIEERLEKLMTVLPDLGDTRNTYDEYHEPDFWLTRCFYTHRIRYYGQWILLHHTYLPAACSLDRCTQAAFAIVDLFSAWNTRMDCYFRQCVHELGQACEILQYHVDNNTDQKQRALQGMRCLLNAVMQTPLENVARTLPFFLNMQRLVSSAEL